MIDALSDDEAALLLDVCTRAGRRRFAPVRVRQRRAPADPDEIRRILDRVRMHAPGLADNPRYVAFLRRSAHGRLAMIADQTERQLRVRG